MKKTHSGFLSERAHTSKSSRGTPQTSLNFSCLSQNERNLVTASTLSPRAKIKSARVLTRSKMQGLEAIGIFSDFVETKQLFDHGNFGNLNIRNKTIHITDFMRTEQKRKFLIDVGGWEAYLNKKNKFQKESINREVNFKNFFQHSEKMPKFFNTPQNSPRYKKLELNKFGFSNATTEIESKLDFLMKKCDEALSIKTLKLSKSADQIEEETKAKLQKILLR